MVKRKSKRQRDIKSKLMAAICMLLVSTIMMVSSTYAWFTLSTAPEVTGIQTAVGANGNLEMALMPASGEVDDITSAVGDSSAATGQTVVGSNVTWGNLVDLDDPSYGLAEITLYPAALNIGADGKLGESFLATPNYGADGRVSELAMNTVTGRYSENSFMPSDELGVRAVGNASGMTDRQLAYRNARGAASTAMGLATKEARLTLNANGAALGNLAIKKGTSEADVTYTAAEIAPLSAMIDDLETKVLPQIEEAYIQYILAYASSKAGQDVPITDETWGLINAAVKGGTDLETLMDGYASAVPAEAQTGIAKYYEMVQDVATAKAALPAEKDTYVWGDFNTVFYALMNPDTMTVNGFEVTAIKNDTDAFVKDYMQKQSLTLLMASGSGIFSDIADQCGDYSASIEVDIEYSGVALEDVPATMKTDAIDNPYLPTIGVAVERALSPEGAGEGEMPITDMYGYVIDLAFRTNAASSDLKLQVEAADRIYSDNTNEETMGHGSSMTFASTSDSFEEDNIKSLMDAIRIVFFDPTTKEIIATAKLDATNADLGNDGWTAEMYIYETTAATTTYTAATTEQITDATTVIYTKAADSETYTKVEDKTGAVTDGSVTYYVATVNEGSESAVEDNIIMSLTQNTAHQLSVLVYLDGEEITNADVAANVAKSLTGTMNLQFSSSATLVPMEYADLHTPTGDGNTGADAGADAGTDTQDDTTGA